MTPSTQSIGALIASRICHDLISPIGAITNGLELMEMAGGIGGDEMNLVSESTGNASARIRFFRISFGMTTADQMVSDTEISTILRDLAVGGRNSIDWQATGGFRRREVQAVFQAILCLETSLPMGGTITVTNSDGTWSVTGQGPKILHDPVLWGHLEQSSDVAVRPAHVQFLLLPETLQHLDRSINLQVSTEKICIRF